MNRLSEEEKRYLKYQIYTVRYDDPWIPDKKVAKILNRSISTIERYAKKAEEEGVIWNPTLGVYRPDRAVALLKYNDKLKAFNDLQQFKNIDYICVCQGDWDITVVYNGQVDFSAICGYKQTIMQKHREVIFTLKVQHMTWETCFTRMDNFVREADTLEKSDIDCNPCYPPWDEEDWIMYYYFESNVRKKFSELRKKHPISWRKFEEWKKTLRTYSTFMMEYYPGGNNAYDSAFLCFKTDYGKKMVEFFSTMPTTCFYHKMGKHMMVGIFLPQDYRQQTRFYELISNLIEKNVISEYMDGNSVVYFIRELEGGRILR